MFGQIAVTFCHSCRKKMSAYVAKKTEGLHHILHMAGIDVQFKVYVELATYQSIRDMLRHNYMGLNCATS